MKKKSILLLVSFVILFIIAAGGCGKADGGKPLVVAMELAYPPFETRNDAGEPAGLSVDLMKAFGEYAGREIKIENTAWDGLIPSLQTGAADIVISSMTIRPDRARQVDFSDPYANALLAVLANADSGIETIESLNQPGKKIAVKSGSTGHLYAQDNLTEAELIILPRLRHRGIPGTGGRLYLRPAHRLPQLAEQSGHHRRHIHSFSGA